MSYDVYIHCDQCGEDQTHGQNNMTSNLAKMWTAAGCPIKDLSGKPAFVFLPHLEMAIHNLKADPEHFQQYNPPNGWGDYDACLSYLKWLAKACRRNLFATVSVSH